MTLNFVIRYCLEISPLANGLEFRICFNSIEFELRKYYYCIYI